MGWSLATAKRDTFSQSPMPATNDENPVTHTVYRRQPQSQARSTLIEALKGDPFATGKTISSSERKRSPPADPILSLNDDLIIFARVYPDVKIEVLRELLLRFDGESRLQISTEQLLKYKSQWARGRSLNPPRDIDQEISTEELFRSKTYITACSDTLSSEFKTLNRSVIDAVLAEVNQSYSKARPILQGIVAKSWKATISSFFKRKKGQDHPPVFLVADKVATDCRLRTTGDEELDQELEHLFLGTLRKQQRKAQEQADADLAININYKEAEEAQALFECQVCYDDVPFEFIVTCTPNAHSVCRSCVQRSVEEAIFGQGWNRTVDMEYGTLRCIASNVSDSCDGHISSNSVHIAVLASATGRETWKKFEQRLANDNILKAGLPLTQCLFCAYAEASQVYSPKTASLIEWRFRKQHITASLILAILTGVLLIPIIFISTAVLTLILPGLPCRAFYTSLANIYQQTQTIRFRCKHAECSRSSCLACLKPWHDPHTCHEPLILSLRTAVEAARTTALKRTCPRCGTSFVKSSGCNKLTCICGYAMCYLCRKNIGKTNENGAVDDRDGSEGYRHFCEHFRPLPGQKCLECNKCDLYMNEDEEVVVKKAGEEAEREWREREGMVGVTGLGLEEAVGSLGKVGNDTALTNLRDQLASGNWTLQDLCDWIVKRLIVIED